MRTRFRPDLRPWLSAATCFMSDTKLERSGVATIDYALLAGLIAMAAAAAVETMGDTVHAMYDTISTIFVQALS